MRVLSSKSAVDCAETIKLDLSFESQCPICLHPEYTQILAAYDIQPSMSRLGDPYDNAKAESFMKALKQEEIRGSSYRN
jgi:transposase InsO family protein